MFLQIKIFIRDELFINHLIIIHAMIIKYKIEII
jgi:hypothetical protein